jgi:GTP-binding protein EngB required for normal cell division
MSKKKGQKDQQWFDEKHSKDKIINITGGRKLNFTGSLKIEGFKNLETINLKKLKLASLEISDCPRLDKITDLIELTKLTSLSVTGCPKLITLNYSSNGLTSLEINGCSQLRNIDLSKFTKLKKLYVRGYHNLITLDCSSIEKLTNLKISGCKQLESIIKASKLESLSVIDCPKLTKLDYSTNGLTSLEISGCNKLENITSLSKASKLTSLSIIYCSNITKLDCSSSEKLTELEVSDLIELKCSNTSIKSLSVNLCPGIQILDCSNNDKLINLDISNCKELKFLDCSNSKLTSLDINNCEFLVREYREYEQNGILSKKLKFPSDLKIIQKRINKNIVIVGRTGGGKSTLSNVLTGTDDFEESGRSISVTKNFQKEGFEYNGKYFNVVDTIGVGDTKLSTKKVLYKVLDGIFSIPEGISQILFVIDGRFTAEEAKIFNLLKGSIFDIFEIGILVYVTIVRTKFSNFKNKEECEADKNQLHNENENIAKIVRSCKDVVYVDNPPVNIQINDDDDEDTVRTNKRIRERSRKIMLNYLDKECQIDYFKLKAWDDIRKPIAEYLESNCDDVPPELEKNQEVQTLIKITESFCSIT